MNRLNFSLPEFTRVVWTSDRAQEVWKPRVDRINNIWPLIERWTVINRLRGAALQSVTPDKLIDLQTWCLDNHQQCLVLAQEGTTAVYGNATKPYDPNKPWTYRVYIGNSPREFRRHWTEGNNRKIAEALGYPICCGEFFHNVWQKDGWRDLTLAMTGFQSTVVQGPATCNILLRHIGIRSVFHLPCAFDCPETARLGKHILDCIDDLGYHQELEWLYEMLNWPVRWSSLHGVAMITTPCFKIITSTDSLGEVIVIDRPGSEYPLEGATGTTFPFEQQVQVIKIKTKDNWTDNGFASREAMDSAHELILKAMEHVLPDPGNVLDLGCGNGELLKKITRRFEHLSPYGVEIDEKRYEKAQSVGLIFNTNVTDIATYSGRYEMIFISFNRFKEISRLQAGLLLGELRAITKYLFIYCYENWLDSDLDDVILQGYDLISTEQSKMTEVRILKPKPWLFTE